MPSLTIDALDLSKNEALYVTYHDKTREWWAVVTHAKRDKVRATGTGQTPIEALANLLLVLGISLDGVN